MFERLHRQMTLFCAAVTGIILVVMTLLCLFPVSYTHLDVYKRQGIGGPAGAAGAATSDSGSRAAADLSWMQKSWKTVEKPCGAGK